MAKEAIVSGSHCRQTELKSARVLLSLQFVLLRHACPVCCQLDSTTYKFDLKNVTNMVGYDWILKNPKRRQKRVENYCTMAD